MVVLQVSSVRDLVAVSGSSPWLRKTKLWRSLYGRRKALVLTSQRGRKPGWLETVFCFGRPPAACAKTVQNGCTAAVSRLMIEEV